MTTGILILHGSSGTPDLDRARILRDEGYDVLAPAWPVRAEVPLESFPLDELAERNDRLVVMGSSWGAEAALLLGALDERVNAVVGFAPSAYVWARVDDDGHQRSAWTWQGEPLPFVPFDPDWKADADPPSYTGMYWQSLRKCDDVESAEIPVERIRDVLLIAGGDDKVWPSVAFAAEIGRRRGALPTRQVVGEAAGHRVVLPGELPKNAGQRMARGGTEAADRELGARAWPEILAVLAG
ncbi:acyl-CoA thioester hydrolase/BAAT C-terminal domain-containing protein [Kribbella albertanoniae]|uniref:Acyl-CoA thioesterase n=1 Tax=Kribbella albertanoniae TaxID=1266829 RepID=A0A4R4PZW3_9ACTN|nr:acyl-CoA thioester hydrolase/BAAT C-terminal domain-containing protein [Kribbella albertanoniae]TDC28144.1 acyl-CoA thioesterase [Kribbella albertanoniae]